MKLTGNDVQEENLLMALDKGIEDMENGKELSLEDVFKLIDKLNIKRKQLRTFDDYLDG